MCANVRPRRVASIALLFSATVLLPLAATGAEVPSGTHLLLRLVNSVSSRTAKAGEYVYFRTASPIVVQNRIVVPVNSYVQGEVTFVKRPGRIAGRGALGLRLDTLTLPRGETLQFSPALSSVDSGESGQKVEGSENTIDQGSQHGRDAGTILITAGRGAAVGAIADRSVRGAGIGAGAGAGVGLATVMLTRGREVLLQRGSSIDVVLNRPLMIEGR